MTDSAPTPFTISRAEPGDAAALSEIAQRSKALWPYPAEWLEEWRPLLTIDSELIASSLVYVARQDAVALGFYALSFVGGTASLDHLWVDSRWVRHGVGRELLAHARSVASQRGCTVLELDSDPYAEPFYLAMGAVRVGTTPAPVAGQWRELPRLRLSLAPGLD